MEPFYLNHMKRKPIYGQLNDKYPVELSDYSDAEPDPEVSAWTNAQFLYLMEDVRRKTIIKAYTYHGDVIANAYLRRTLTEPKGILTAIKDYRKTIPFAYQIYDNYDNLVKNGLTLPDRATLLEDDGRINEPVMYKLFVDNFDYFLKVHNLNMLMKDYCKELYTIIVNAPRAPRDILVYRGRKSEQSLPPGLIRFKSDSFISTSMSLDVAMKFTEGYAKYHCCLYEITIRKGTPCLYINELSKVYNEFEVLLPYNVVFTHSHKVRLRKHYGYPILVRNIVAEGITEADVEPLYVKVASKKKAKKTRSRNLPRVNTAHRKTVRKGRFSKHYDDNGRNNEVWNDNEYSG